MGYLLKLCSITWCGRRFSKILVFTFHRFMRKCMHIYIYVISMGNLVFSQGYIYFCLVRQAHHQVLWSIYLHHTHRNGTYHVHTNTCHHQSEIVAFVSGRSWHPFFIHTSHLNHLVVNKAHELQQSQSHDKVEQASSLSWPKLLKIKDLHSWSNTGCFNGPSQTSTLISFTATKTTY